jgi:hypothetical protein
MELAENKSKLEEKLKTKSATMADLTLNGAFQLIKAAGDSGSGSRQSEAYDKVEKKLIDKLKDMAPETAEAAASETIKQLKDTVATIKKAAASAAAALSRPKQEDVPSPAVVTASNHGSQAAPRRPA